LDQRKRPAVKKSIGILFVEDSEDDTLLMVHQLKRAGMVHEYERVDTAETFRNALTQKAWDLILCDYKLPQFDGLHALEIYREWGIDIPFIIVSGNIGEDIAVATIKAGAHDYLMKDNLGRLVPAIERVLQDADLRAERRQTQEMLRESNEELSAIYDNAPLIMVLFDEQARIFKSNVFASNYASRGPAEMRGLSCGNLLKCTHSRDAPEGCGFGSSCPKCTLRNLIREATQQGRRFDEVEVNITQKNFLVSAKQIVVRGQSLALVSIQDITDRKLAEKALQESETRYRSVVNTVGDGVILQEASGRIVDWNLYAEEVFGLKAEEVLGKTSTHHNWTLIRRDGSPCPAEEQPSVLTLRTGKSCSNEIMGVKKSNGDVRWVSINTRPLFTEGDGRLHAVVTSFTDITEQRNAEMELVRSHSRLRDLTVRLQEVREQERKAMARAIHDELGQALTGLKMEIEWVRTLISGDRGVHHEQIASRLESMGKIADVTIQGMRRIITELRPSLLDDLGLAPALKWMAQEYSKRTGIECSFHCPSGPIETDPERSVAAFRIVQEALNNILRHAGAAKVSVTVQIESGHLLLTVIDDGRGFSEEDLKKKRTYGILGMKERVHSLEGNFDIQGMPDIGTTVSVRIPLAPLAGKETAQ